MNPTIPTPNSTSCNVQTHTLHYPVYKAHIENVIWTFLLQNLSLATLDSLQRLAPPIQNRWLSLHIWGSCPSYGSVRKEKVGFIRRRSWRSRRTAADILGYPVRDIWSSSGTLSLLILALFENRLHPNHPCLQLFKSPWHDSLEEAWAERCKPLVFLNLVVFITEGLDTIVLKVYKIILIR